MGELAMRSRRLGPVTVDKRRFAYVCGLAVVVLVSIPVELNAEAVLPSQVTPQTLRPPTAGARSLGGYGADDSEVLPRRQHAPKKKSSKSKGATSGANGNKVVPGNNSELPR